MTSQLKHGHPGKVAKQLQNYINRSIRKEFTSPHLFLHFYVFENCVNSPRFCKHCSKCSCVSHCKNPCSDLKKNIYKKRQSNLIFSRQCGYHHFSQLFSQDLEKKIFKEINKNVDVSELYHSLFSCFFSPPSIPSPSIMNPDAELTILFISKNTTLLQNSAFFSLLLCSVQKRKELVEENKSLRL